MVIKSGIIRLTSTKKSMMYINLQQIILTLLYFQLKLYQVYQYDTSGRYMSLLSTISGV